MSFVIVDPASIGAGRGPHPAASPFDKRVGEALGVSAFQVYQVELPPGAETVTHDHLADKTEDVYVVLRGDGGWLSMTNPCASRRASSSLFLSSRAVVFGRVGPGWSS